MKHIIEKIILKHINTGGAILKYKYSIKKYKKDNSLTKLLQNEFSSHIKNVYVAIL